MPSHSKAPYISEQLSAPVFDELNAIKASLTGNPFASIRRRTAVMVALYWSRWNSSATRNILDTGVLSTGTFVVGVASTAVTTTVIGRVGGAKGARRGAR